MIDVDSLKQRTDIAQVVGHFVPLLKRGREWVGKCVAHSPDNHPSMWIAPSKGLIHCFACGWSGDVIDFLMHVEGVDFRTACERLGATDRWEPSLSVPTAAPQPARITSKPPLGTDSPDMTLRGLGRPSRVWPYRDTNGDLLGYAARYENEDGKEFRCWTYGSRGDEPAAWGVGHWNRPRPLYGLDRLTTRATDPVLIVEGERAADAAGRLLPNYVAVTWPGGAQAVHHADWEAMRGRRALLWPDNDEAGLKAMNGLAAVLADPAGLGCSVKLIDPNREADGFDAADAETAGWTTAQVIEWAKPRVSLFTVKQADTAPERITGDSSGDEPPPADDMAENPPLPPVSLPDTQAPRRQRPRLSVVSREGAAVPALDDEPLPLELSESGIADEFAATHQAELRFVPEWRERGWLVWNGARWMRESRRTTAMQKMRGLAHCLKYRTAALALSPSSKSALESKRYVGNVLDLAESDRRLLATPQQWDADPYLLGVPGGAVDLRTGDQIEAMPEHYITRQTAVAPTAGPTPLFDRVIGQAADGDAEMLAYLWRWLGYCLTGDVREESFLFLYGPPACGKTTLIEAVAAILGDVHAGGYAVKTTMDLFIESKLDQKAGKFHVLHGARFAHAAETEEGRHWKAAMMKEATGGDTMIGERKYENEFSFRPTHKLLIHGNHRPHMRQADEGLRRRMQIVEYHAAVSEADRDATLKQRLVAEYPAILFRMIAACLDWQKWGIRPPAPILQAVEDYYDAEDSFGEWVKSCIVRKPGARLSSTGAYTAFRSWLDDRGERAPSHKRFAGMMQARDIPIYKSGGVKFFKDAELAQSALPPIPDDWR